MSKQCAQRKHRRQRNQLNKCHKQAFFKVAGGTDNHVEALIPDGSGGVYVTGSVIGATGTIQTFKKNKSVQAIGENDIFVAHLDASGCQKFFKLAGGVSFDEGSALISDGHGGVYITGYVEGTSGAAIQTFKKDEIIYAIGGSDVFVAHLDACGRQKFFKLAGGIDEDQGLALAPDEFGGVYITGFVNGRPGDEIRTFDEDEKRSAIGNNDIFVAHLDAHGRQKFFKLAGGIDFDQGVALAPDKLGGVYVTGSVEGTTGAAIQTFRGGETVYTIGSADIFVAHLDACGRQEFFKLAGGVNVDEGIALASDDHGGVYVTGRVTGQIGSNEIQTFENGEKRTAIGNNDIFVAHLDARGCQKFFKLAGGSSNDQGVALAPDGCGGVYVTGFVEGTAGAVIQTFKEDENAYAIGNSDIFVAHLDPCGRQKFFKLAGGIDTDQGLALAPDKSGGVYVTGFVKGTSGAVIQTFKKNKPVYALGKFDIFVAHLDACGRQKLFRLAGGVNIDVGFALAPDKSGGIYVAGLLGENSKDFLGNTVDTIGSADIFLSRIKYTCST